VLKLNKRIKMYVNSWIFGDEKIENIMERAKEIGFDGIELVGEPSIIDVEYVKKLIKIYQLDIISICGMFPGPAENDLRALSHNIKEEREKAIKYVIDCIDMAKAVNARSVLVVPSLVGNPVYFESKEKDWERAVESLKIVAEYAEKQQIYLTIEPINRYEVGLVNSIDDAIKMAKEVNNKFVRIMGDTFHMQIEENESIDNTIRRAGNYWLQHLHVADNTREAPGKGTMPWERIIKALYEIDYEGGISFEPLPKGKAPYEARQKKIARDKLDTELKFGLKYLRNVDELVQMQMNN